MVCRQKKHRASRNRYNKKNVQHLTKNLSTNNETKNLFTSYSTTSNQSNGSVVSQALNRITEFLKFDQRTETLPTTIPAVFFDEKSLCTSENSNRILIEKPEVEKILFQCQLAHGSPTAIVSNFKNPAELYQKIADSYDDIKFEDILFCTRNTHRIDMSSVLSGTLATSDFIFAHIKGQKKEIELSKDKKMLGITLSDNSAGRVFIRKIANNSQLSRAQPAIEVGDHIESINNESMIGKRHYQVANVLQLILPGETFKLRLISPLKNGFSFISVSRQINTKSLIRSALNIPDKVQTIRFKSVGGKPVIEETPNQAIIERLNDVFDNYFGFNDDELATTMLELGNKSKNVVELENAVKASSLETFNFGPKFIFDLWKVINDWKQSCSNFSQKKEKCIASSTLEKSNSDLSKIKNFNNPLCNCHNKTNNNAVLTETNLFNDENELPLPPFFELKTANKLDYAMNNLNQNITFTRSTSNSSKNFNSLETLD